MVKADQGARPSVGGAKDSLAPPRLNLVCGFD